MYSHCSPGCGGCVKCYGDQRHLSKGIFAMCAFVFVYACMYGHKNAGHRASFSSATGVNMHKYMHTDTRTCIHTHMHTRIAEWNHVMCSPHTYIYTCIHTYQNGTMSPAPLHTNYVTYSPHTYINTYIHTYMHNCRMELCHMQPTHIHIHMHTHIHNCRMEPCHMQPTHIHTHLHTHLQNGTMSHAARTHTLSKLVSLLSALLAVAMALVAVPT